MWVPFQWPKGTNVPTGSSTPSAKMLHDPRRVYAVSFHAVESLQGPGLGLLQGVFVCTHSDLVNAVS